MNLILSKMFKSCLKMNLPPKFLLLLGAWRKAIINKSQVQCLTKITEPSKNSIDIGAHYGAITYWLSRLSSHVYAYEPNRDCYEFLLQSVPENVTLFNLGVSNLVGRTSFYVPNSLKDLSALGSFHKSVFKEGELLTEIATNITSLDHEGHSNIGFIKIDTEGHEVHVIEGAQKLLAAEKPNLMVEISSGNLALVSHLTRDYGYVSFFLEKGGWKEVSNADKGGDYLFLKRPMDLRFSYSGSKNLRVRFDQ